MLSSSEQMGSFARAFLVAMGAVGSLACGLDDRGDGASTTVVGIGGQSADAGLSGAGGAGATGGAGAVAGAGSGGFAGGTLGGGENCTDGIDDDKDGAPDCADPDCAQYSCVPRLPVGFTGFARVRGEGVPPVGAEGPTCPDGSPPTRYLSNLAGPAQCSACSCGGLQGATCGPAGLFCKHADSDCTGAQDWSGKIGGGCTNGDGGQSKLSCFATPAAVAQQGSCEPSTSTNTDTDAYFGVSDVCRQPAGQGCSAGQACVANGTGEYAGFICVEQPGEVPCPSEYSVAIVGYKSVQDNRSCSACQCTPSQVTCDAPEYSFYDGWSCGGSRKTVTSTTCQNLSGLLDWGTWSYKTTHNPQAFGTCLAQGGSPQGSVAGVGAITFCCRSVL